MQFRQEDQATPVPSPELEAQEGRLRSDFSFQKVQFFPEPPPWQLAWPRLLGGAVTGGMVPGWGVTWAFVGATSATHKPEPNPAL